MLGEAGVCVSVHGQGMGKGESLQWSLGSGHGQAHGPAPVGWAGLLSMWKAGQRAWGPCERAACRPGGAHSDRAQRSGGCEDQLSQEIFLASLPGEWLGP